MNIGGRHLATYVALLGVEIWNPFRGVPNRTLTCINVGVKWDAYVRVVVVSGKMNTKVNIRFNNWTRYIGFLAL